MEPIVFPMGETLSRTGGEFLFSPLGIDTFPMKTVEETRRERLQMLVRRHGGMANLCEKLGFARNETATLTRILNGNVRHERGGTPYNMGSPMARSIETKLGLEPGWMDTPPAFSEQHPMTEPMDKIATMLAAMEPEMQYRIVKMVAALAEPPKEQAAHH